MNYIRLIEKLSGFHIMRQLPHGIDLLIDIKHLLPSQDFRMIFDVGANVGQSALVFAHRCPRATVFAFEPSESTYRKLVNNTAHQERIQCIRLALGDSPGEVALAGDGCSARVATGGEKEVEIETLDRVCEARGIEHIDFLKIDTEGYDHRVLKGAARMLAAQQIDVVQVEAGMNPGNSDHVPLEVMKSDLENSGYRMFGLYDQVQEWPKASPVLRRVNAVCVSERVAGANTGRR